MKKYLWFVMMTAMITSAGMVVAQQKPVPKNPCVRDGAKFCPVSKSPRTYIICMNEHKEALTEVCANAIGIIRSAGEKMRKSCSSDSAKLCKGTGPARLQCLFKNEASLSPACKKDFTTWSRARYMVLPAQLRVKIKN